MIKAPKSIGYIIVTLFTLLVATISYFVLLRSLAKFEKAGDAFLELISCTSDIETAKNEVDNLLLQCPDK
jgi:hypothetical protein